MKHTKWSDAQCANWFGDKIRQAPAYDESFAAIQKHLTNVAALLIPDAINRLNKELSSKNNDFTLVDYIFELSAILKIFEFEDIAIPISDRLYQKYEPTIAELIVEHGTPEVIESYTSTNKYGQKIEYVPAYFNNFYVPDGQMFAYQSNKEEQSYQNRHTVRSIFKKKVEIPYLLDFLNEISKHLPPPSEAFPHHLFKELNKIQTLTNDEIPFVISAYIMWVVMQYHSITPNEMYYNDRMVNTIPFTKMGNDNGGISYEVKISSMVDPLTKPDTIPGSQLLQITTDSKRINPNMGYLQDLHNRGILRRIKQTSKTSDSKSNIEYYLFSDMVDHALLNNATIASYAVKVSRQIKIPKSEYEVTTRSPIDTVTHQMFTKLVSAKNIKGGHILIYGDAGRSKTSYVKSALASMNIPAYEICAFSADGSRWGELNQHKYNCMHMNIDHHVVIIDEADDMFNVDARNRNNNPVYDKAKAITSMEINKLVCVWIMNNVYQIDPAIKRRFDLVIRFDDPPKDVLHRCVNYMLIDNKMTKLLSDDELNIVIDNYSDVPLGKFHDTILKYKKLYGNRPNMDKFTRELNSYIQLISNGWAHDRHSKPTHTFEYDPAIININKGSMSIRELIDNLQPTADAILHNKPIEYPGANNVLFYGIPGGSKSHTAKYIAKRLGMNYKLYKASDILDKYVGGTEQNIAKMFSLAERNKHILIIDEIDSFLFSRDNAIRSWETTQINEFLTWLEEFKGILIATTNRRPSLDNAVLRRFTHKVEFDYMTPDQVVYHFNELFDKHINGVLGDIEIANLRSLTKLAPGDFKVVHLQHRHRKSSVTELIDALRFEQGIKPGSKSIGFSQ